MRLKVLTAASKEMIVFWDVVVFYRVLRSDAVVLV
jgi:hypothetical protein